MKEILIAIIGSGLFSGALASLFSMISSRSTARKFHDESVKNIENGLKLLLLSSMKRDGQDALRAGSIKKEDYDAFAATYTAYKALGGDGWADKVFAQVKALPVDFDD